MPRDIVQKLNGELGDILSRDQDTRRRLLEMGAEPSPGTPEQLGAHVLQELEKWDKVIRAAKIKLE